jgi:hypothetical protein
LRDDALQDFRNFAHASFTIDEFGKRLEREPSCWIALDTRSAPVVGFTFCALSAISGCSACLIPKTRGRNGEGRSIRRSGWIAIGLIWMAISGWTERPSCVVSSVKIRTNTDLRPELAVSIDRHFGVPYRAQCGLT